MKAITERTTAETHELAFTCRISMLFITLPSGRNLAYVKPRIGMNQFGGESVTYEGVGTAKRWERIESYDPKSLEALCEEMGRTPPWAKGLILQAAGYTSPYYKKD